MKRHSFFVKLFFGNLLLVAIIVGIGGFLSYRRLNATHVAESRAHQLGVLRMARVYFQRRWPELDGRVPRIDADCKLLATGADMRLTVIAADGRVLGDSEADPLRMENHNTPDRREVQIALKGRQGVQIRASETLGVEFRYVAEPVLQAGEVAAIVRVAMPVLAIARHRELVRDSLLWAAAGAVAAAVMLALLLSWIWYAPLREITRTARTLADGDLSRRADISGSDELAQLGAALNEMGRSLASKIHQIATQRENLVAVVENLREGVIGTDRQGRIVLMNSPALELLADGADDVVGRHLQTVIRIPEIVDVLNEVVAGGRPVDRQMELTIRHRRCTFSVHADRLSTRSADEIAVLLVVRDVTDLVRTATIKAEFVANASHELRTPLATIRAAVDSLAAVEPAEADELRRLTDILDRHTARLEEMTNDLLNLHLVESGRQKLNREPIDLGSLAAWVRDHFAQRVSEKGIRFVAECSDPAAEFDSDLRLIQVILQNLVDNAVKFTPADGEVRCRFDAEGDRLVIRVSDTGCGIPPDIRDRVFERFFQADLARSGEPRKRGTGLGLAIVKHAADRLGAQIGLDSRLNHGTTVTVTIPGQPAADAPSAAS